MPIPLVPSRPSSSKGTVASVAAGPRMCFAQASLERHRRYAELEAQAENDTERLEIFAEFIVNESRIRRDLYSEAFENMGSDILDLTRDLWRSYSGNKKSKPSRPGTSEGGRVTPVNNSKEIPASVSVSPSAASDSQTSGVTPQSESESSSSVQNPLGPNRSNSQQRQNNFQPCLSPIPSMALSTIPDDLDSRGRAASRWFEASTGADSVGDARKVERSKKEAKYMGVPREARENMQWDIPENSPLMNANNAGAGFPYHELGPDEYPPEKTGWHEEEPPAGSPGLARFGSNHADAFRLDVSRLVTLPPPYPRHHPAVNNNHPDLAPLRSALRELTDKSEARRVHEDYQASLPSGQERSDSLEAAAASRRSKLRHRIQNLVNSGEMTFAEAAQEEATFDEEESRRSRDEAQRTFEHFQEQVMSPLNTLFTERISKATGCMDELRESLNIEALSQNPNQTQEEGDEQPELLEKLSLMKWFHEAREHLHKDIFELESESDNQYKTVILVPYKQMGNHDKIHEVETFFWRDVQDRRDKYERAAQSRMESLLKTVEEHVSRGVEVQLSAFWDIAPPLLDVIQKVPSDLEGFEVEIPPHEYDENPSYHEFPAQYLYSLLLHARNSTYQFIESQTNLLCLLHEAKSGVMMAGCRLLETQRILAGEEEEVVKQEMREVQEGEDRNLTVDLKERVGLVEEQWRQALAKGLDELEDRIKTFLFENGGWDESLEE